MYFGVVAISSSRGIFPTQGSNPLSLWSACISQAGSLPLAPPGKPPSGPLETSSQSLSVVSDSLRPHGLYMDSPGHNTVVGGRSLLPAIDPGRPHCRRILYQLSHQGSPTESLKVKVKSLSRVRLFATPWTVAYQAPPSVGFSRQEYWSGLPFPSPGDLNPGITQVSRIAGRRFTI